MYTAFQRNVKNFKYMILIDHLNGYQKGCVDLSYIIRFGLTLPDIDKYFAREKIIDYKISPHGNIYFQHEEDANKCIDWLIGLETMRQMGI